MSRNIRQDMLDYLPKYYGDFAALVNVVDRNADEVIALNAAISDVLAQFFIDTATWGLARWEAICGIKTDESKPLDVRRAIVKSRIQGAGTVTVEVIRTLADTLYGTSTQVSEDYTNARVVVTLVGKRGIDSHKDDVKRELRELIPAHLEIALEFTWFVWNEFDALTWDDADTFTWDELEVHMP